MPLDSDLAAYLAHVAAAIPLPDPVTPSSRRARTEAIVRRFPYPPDAVAREDHWLHLPGREVLVRIYRPAPGRLPAFLYLHGGGWVLGSVQSHDGACAALAADAHAVVASVQYRRAPENPWPAPNDDAFAALQWLADAADGLDVDAQRIAVAGDSAGAHLALGVAIEARDRGGPHIALQHLVYPVLEPDFETASYRAHAVSPTLTRAEMIAFWNDYLPAGLHTGDARAVPTRAPLHGLPPAAIIVAGFDPLYDDGRALATRLAAAGVSATLDDEPTLAHGFVRAAPFVPRARAAMRAFNERAGRMLREGR